MNQMTRTTAVEYAPRPHPGQRDPAGPDENADGRAFGGPGGELRQGRRRGDVARARRAGADGPHGRRLGRRQRRAVSRLRRIEIRHRRCATEVVDRRAIMRKVDALGDRSIVRRRCWALQANAAHAGNACPHPNPRPAKSGARERAPPLTAQSIMISDMPPLLSTRTLLYRLTVAAAAQRSAQPAPRPCAARIRRSIRRRASRRSRGQ